MTENNELIQLIDLLEKNKKFPYYAAERRIDLLLIFYIERILKDYFKQEIVYVAPEFPIKHEGNNQADKADILCAFKESKKPIIIEIKTDKTSFKPEQLKKYINSASDWKHVVCGLSEIIKNSKSNYRIKYFYLMQRMVETGVAEYHTKNKRKLIQEIECLLNASSKKDKGKRSKKIIQLAEDFQPYYKNSAELVYMIPGCLNDKYLKEQENNDKIKVLRFSEISLYDNSKNGSYCRFISLLKAIT